jgi:hypothetical protein
MKRHAYDLEGVPQSRQMTIVERFTPSEGGFDPTLEFLPYDCIEEERRARAPR